MELLQLQNEQGPCLVATAPGRRSACPTSPMPLLNGRASWPRSRRPERSGRCTRSRCVCAERPSGVEPVPPHPRSAARGRPALGQPWPMWPPSGSFRNRRSGAAGPHRTTPDRPHQPSGRGTGQGVLAQHHNLSMDVAFDRLRRYCRYHNLRLAEVARQLTTRELNPETIPAPAPTGSRHRIEPRPPVSGRRPTRPSAPPNRGYHRLRRESGPCLR